jgi:hypothetical protein
MQLTSSFSGGLKTSGSAEDLQQKCPQSENSCGLTFAGRFQNSMKLLADAAVHVLFDCVGWLDWLSGRSVCSQSLLALASVSLLAGWLPRRHCCILYLEIVLAYSVKRHAVPR